MESLLKDTPHIEHLYCANYVASQLRIENCHIIISSALLRLKCYISEPSGKGGAVTQIISAFPIPFSLLYPCYN